MKGKANRLINETSPYLLQHAHNPVDWYPWGAAALEKARTEDLPILLSIGYSACHWCHVMERESFENQAIADLMNTNFVCIKLDREERPDIDQVYMEAIQIMGIPGGWPLNVFLTPGQKPFYGGTYFPPDRWSQLLTNIAQAYKTNRGALDSSAEKFHEALNVGVVEKYRLQGGEEDKDLLDQAIARLEATFDREYGGIKKAPKFPMPVIWNFLLHYCAPDRPAGPLDQLYLTLDKMAQGGIYDQIGGGFARYSVDERWFAPHFEKMLYDNAQLVSLYSLAYSLSKKERYRRVVYQTIDFLHREMHSPQGGFYSALDADSEGHEGKFYVWQYDDFQDVVEKDGDFLVDLYGLTPEGNWEQGQNILYRSENLDAFASRNKMDINWLRNTLDESHEKLLKARNQRPRPGLDHKIICGWNGLMIKGLADAYAVFSEPRFKDLALKCAIFIEKFMAEGEQLFRTYAAKGTKVPAFLEDYAAIISAYLNLYQVTFEEKWLYRAQNLMSYAQDNFYDHEEQLFFYTDSSDNLIARKKELFDNVIPSSNSIMLHNLWLLGTILGRNSYLELCDRMLSRVKPLIKSDPAYLSHWATTLSYLQFTSAEIAISGEKSEVYRKRLAAHFHPHKIMVGSNEKSTLPLLKDRAPARETKIYVCYNQTCQLPTGDPEVAISQLTY